MSMRINPVLARNLLNFEKIIKRFLAPCMLKNLASNSPFSHVALMHVIIKIFGLYRENLDSTPIARHGSSTYYGLVAFYGGCAQSTVTLMFLLAKFSQHLALKTSQ